MKGILLPGPWRDRLIEWSGERDSREACGVLAGTRRAGRIEIAAAFDCQNRSTLDDGFEIDPGAIVAAERAARRLGLHIVGFWHAHRSGPAVPSSRDIARGSWPGFPFLVVSSRVTSSVRAWRSLDGALVELELTVRGTGHVPAAVQNARLGAHEPARMP